MTKTKWNNLAVFFAGTILALIVTPFLEPYYSNILDVPAGNFLFSEKFNTYPLTFFFLYTLFLTFFYRAFSKNFKPINLVYFLALPFLLFVSSTAHLAVFLSLLVVGWLLGFLIQKILPR